MRQSRKFAFVDALHGAGRGIEFDIVAVRPSVEETGPFVFNPDNRHLHHTNDVSGDVTVVDEATLKAGKSVKLERSRRGVAILAVDRVTNQALGRVMQFEQCSPSRQSSDREAAMP